MVPYICLPICALKLRYMKITALQQQEDATALHDAVYTFQVAATCLSSLMKLSRLLQSHQMKDVLGFSFSDECSTGTLVVVRCTSQLATFSVCLLSAVFAIIAMQTCTFMCHIKIKNEA